MRSADVLDAQGIVYDTQRTSISKLQAAQPSNQIEVIFLSENKQMTAWGDTHASPLSVC